jgi:hypothetical protein
MEILFTTAGRAWRTSKDTDTSSFDHTSEDDSNEEGDEGEGEEGDDEAGVYVENRVWEDEEAWLRSMPAHMLAKQNHVYVGTSDAHAGRAAIMKSLALDEVHTLRVYPAYLPMLLQHPLLTCQFYIP